MLFSRVELAPASAADLADSGLFATPYTVHQAVWKLFSNGEPRDRDFLFRVERLEGRPLVFTLSARPPKDSKGLWRIESKLFAPDLRAGDRLAFRLRANPTIRRKEAGADSGQRCDAIYDARRREKAAGLERSVQEVAQEVGEAWLRRKSAELGFELETVAVDGYEVHRFKKKGQEVSVATCDFEGRLTVTDPERFRTTLATGIGSAKGFGNGLLLVKRA
jgi:CRISPR system Cascade subunit CasE